jgi:hypothetical protein
MKRYTSRQLISFLSAPAVVGALLILGRPLAPWLVLGAMILSSIVLIPAFALAFLLRAIGRSPDQHVILPEETPVLPRRHRSAIGWLPGDLR